jgi:hypothetical protein
MVPDGLHLGRRLPTSRPGWSAFAYAVLCGCGSARDLLNRSPGAIAGLRPDRRSHLHDLFLLGFQCGIDGLDEFIRHILHF